MSNTNADLLPYSFDFEEAFDADSADENECFILNIGEDESGTPTRSLERILEVMACSLENLPQDMKIYTKLYVFGTWVMAYEEDSEAQREAYHRQRVEWSDAAEYMAKLIETMPLLKEVTWDADFPFVATILDALPKTLTKLVVNLDHSTLSQKEDDSPMQVTLIKRSEMKSLQKMTMLEELRFLNIPEISLQSVVWGAVFRNQTENGMKVLELQMFKAPAVRPLDWRKAEDVVSLDVSVRAHTANHYKGADGNGILDRSLGFGQYLDVRCIRKARIAAGRAASAPVPLRCLMLNGIIVDHLPFERELAMVELVVFGEACYNAGLDPRMASPSTSPIMMHWPKCAGAYQADDGQ